MKKSRIQLSVLISAIKHGACRFLDNDEIQIENNQIHLSNTIKITIFFRMHIHTHSRKIMKILECLKTFKNFQKYSKILILFRKSSNMCSFRCAKVEKYRRIHFY